MQTLKFYYYFFLVIFLPLNIARVMRLGDMVMQATPDDFFDELLRKDPYLREVTREKYMGTFPTTDEIDKYKPGTLGHAYLTHLQTTGMNSYASLNGQPCESFASTNEYLKERVRYLRDILRFLLNLSESFEDEAALNAFLFSQFPSPLPAAVVGALILRAVFVEPASLTSIFRKVVTAYRCGESSRNFLSIKWETMWHSSVDEARAQLMPSSTEAGPTIRNMLMV